MKLKPDTLATVADAQEQEQTITRSILSLCPPGIPEEHIYVILYLSLGFTNGRTALNTGYSLQYIVELAAQYRETILTLSTRRAEITAGLAQQVVFAITRIGLEATGGLAKLARKNKLTAVDVSNLARAGESFHRLQREILNDAKAMSRPTNPVVKEVKDALAMLPK